MRSKSLAGFFSLVAFIAGCGGDDPVGTAPDAGAISDASRHDAAGSFGDGGTFTGPPVRPAPAERADVRIRVVHLYSPGNGQPGPSIDIYRTGELQARQREARPIVTALTYGTVSETFAPVEGVLQPGELGNTVTFFDTGTRQVNAGVYGGSILNENLRPGDKITVLVMPGRNAASGAALPSYTIYFEARPSAPATVPAAVPDRALVIARDAAISNYGSSFLFHLSAGGACLAGHGSSSGNPDGIGTASKFSFAPGTLTLAAHRLLDPPDCSGTPAAGPITFPGAAGGRTWLWLYGPSMTDLRFLALPFGN